MKCLIVAAGKGSRIARLGSCKPLLKVDGVPLIERVINRAGEAGIREFLVVTGFQGQKIRQHLDRYGPERGLSITCVHNPDWQRKNGLSVLAAQPLVKEPFLLLMADHLFDPSIIRDLIKAGVRKEALRLAVDRRIEHNPLVDLQDVTKVLEHGGRIRMIGKELREYNAFDTGIFLSTPALFEGLARGLTGEDVSLSDGVAAMSRSGRADTYDIGKRFWLDVDDEAAYQKALVHCRTGEFGA